MTWYNWEHGFQMGALYGVAFGITFAYTIYTIVKGK